MNLHFCLLITKLSLTTISGLSETEFLSSIEQFDKSSASWNVPLQRDWRIINHVLNSPRYEMAVASIPVSHIGVIISFFVVFLMASFIRNQERLALERFFLMVVWDYRYHGLSPKLTDKVPCNSKISKTK